MNLFLSAPQLRILALVTAGGIVMGCSDATAPLVPKQLAQAEAPVAEGTVGTVLVTAPTFVVKDESGKSVGGVSVSVSVTAGGGTLTGAPVKSGNGATPVGTWKLGNVAGINSVTVAVAGLPPLVISVLGKAGPPATITFVTGSNQSAAAGTPLPVPLVAQVRDQFGNGVAGAPVTFSVNSGDGLVASAAPVMTDAAGNATAPQWTLGRSAIPQSLRASSGTIVAVANATVATNYTVDVQFFGPPMPDAAGSLFTAAAARINAAVTGDVPDIPARFPGYDLASPTEGCGVDGLPTNFTERVDDIVVFASVGPIDGANNILAFAFPCGLRDGAGGQTFIGIMKFDSDDIQNMITRGVLGDVIQHEMLHLVGIGTLWESLGLIADAGLPGTRYTGSLGVGGCIAVGGASVCPGSIPLEPLSDRAGPGTADSHWSEDVFFNELMTGFVNTRTSVPVGVINPLSAMTIQSIGDLGYTVNENAADTYLIPGTAAARILGQLNVDPAVRTDWERVNPPRIKVSSTGKLSRIADQ